ncbi:MAG: rane-associated zinc metalloprotease, partial [Candidatus Peribacteria bacterium]|nr:rane-associated zinc metalloprotease [Candidatus Peribacteria bacterium]
MSIIISIIAFIFLLSFLVVLHEFGHFSAARKFGVKVEEFGFGLPPRAKTLFWQGGTRFSLNWIPFGGFVRLKGENAENESERLADGSFARAPLIGRIVILIAGVCMNFLLAFAIFTVGFSVGHWIPTYISFEDMLAAADRGDIHLQPGVLIADVTPDGNAAAAKVPPHSLLLEDYGKPVLM